MECQLGIIKLACSAELVKKNSHSQIDSIMSAKHHQIQGPVFIMPELNTAG